MRRIATAVVLVVATVTVMTMPAPASGDDTPNRTAPPVRPIVRDVLPRAMPGEVALRVLPARHLGDVAAQNGQTVDRLTAQLAVDRSAWLDADGMLFFQDAPPPPPADSAVVAAGPFPDDQTFGLHSRPGSSRVLYLDFDGHELPAGNYWRGDAYTAAPFDIDGSPTTWSQEELDAIQGIYLRVAEDYAPFDLDVTTQDPGAAAIARSSIGDDRYGGRVVVTDSPNGDFCGGFCAGVSYVGTVDVVGVDHDRLQPSWVFSDGSSNVQYLANNASHEFGHQMGLSHDGNPAAPLPEYDVGHGMWAPLMGWGFTQPVSQWSRGEYPGATNQEDDFAVAATHGVALVGDDAAAHPSATDDLVPGRSQLIGVAPGGDVDTWRYVAPCSGTFTFSADPSPVSPNLSLALRLSDRSSLLAVDATQPVRVSAEIATGMGAMVSSALARGAVSTLTVSPLANGTPATGWSNYANVGRYSIGVTTTCDPSDLPVLVPGAFGAREGDRGSTQFRIPIRLSEPAAGVVTVRYRTIPTTGIGYATAGVDYTPTSGVVTFRPGQTSASVPVRVFGDTVAETPLYLGEWFFVQFDQPSANARLDTGVFSGRGVGIIGDDD